VDNKYKVEKYRWMVLLSMLPILAMTQVCWLTFAPITSLAVDFYKVTPLQVAFLSMIYMIVYIILALPASWLVDTKGFKASVVTGAVLTAVFGMIRGIFSSNFMIVTIAQIGLAAGQPFLVNSTTKAAARWFPVDERATADGLASMAGYLGMIVTLILTPFLVGRYGIGKVMLIYGYASIACAAVFIVFARERPAIPPGPGEELVHKLNIKDMKATIRKKDFLYLMIVFFVVMGIVNAIMTWIEDILKPRGITPEGAGVIGGTMVAAGIIGAVILPMISDKTKRRNKMLTWPILVAMIGLAGITITSDYLILLVSAAVMGFFVMGLGPIAFQYGAEVAYPVPEGTSYGILMLMGQISGILFIYVMDALRSPSTGAMTISLFIFIILMFASFFLTVRLKESNLIKNAAISDKKSSD